MLKLQDVHVEYPLMQCNSHSLRARFEYMFLKPLRKDIEKPATFIKGLNGINMEIRSGDRVGIIGHNGAGKTTLLRVMSGIFPPTKGDVFIEGEISSLIDTTFGFEDEVSGMKNIEHSLIYNGHTFEEAKEMAPAIAELAQLGDAIYDPIYTYSAGMSLRLAFAIATYRIPEVLIMDEIIGAGDEKFRTIATEKINNLINESNICVISSHDLGAIKRYCNRCILMTRGNIVRDGDVEDVVAEYLEMSKTQ